MIPGFILDGHRNSVASYSHGGWQPEDLAEQSERTLAEILDSQDSSVRRFPDVSDRPQAGRGERLSHFGRKLHVSDGHVIRKFGRWIDHDRFFPLAAATLSASEASFGCALKARQRVLRTCVEPSVQQAPH